MLPFITIVVPVRNEERSIGQTLRELIAQDYPRDRFEIIVADGESTDRTKEILSEIINKHTQVRLVDNPKRLSSAGRNLGFQNGRGDIFVVVDGHCWIGHDQLLKNIVACFEKSGAHCLGRPQPLDPPGLSPFQQAVAAARASLIGHGADSLIYSKKEGFVSPVSHGAVYRREVVETVGPVDESFDACEDVEFNLRVEKAGFKTFMSPSIAVKYYPRESLTALWHQMVRYGRGRFRLLRKHPERLSLTGLVPAGLAAGIVLVPAAAAIHPPAGALGAFLYGSYLTVLFAESLRLARRSGWGSLKYFPLIFLAIHFGLGFGFWSALCKRKSG